jgi:hypothetical protein
MTTNDLTPTSMSSRALNVATKGIPAAQVLHSWNRSDDQVCTNVRQSICGTAGNLRAICKIQALSDGGYSLIAPYHAGKEGWLFKFCSSF